MKLVNSGSGSYCVKEKKACVGLVNTYFKDCLCNFRDELSFGLGLVSLLCWAVAEIPQIITNFRTKSSHGISIFFLLTWVVGDTFNLVGCLLEPATLPTQYYTALLYTTTTILLVLQSWYYDHLYRWWKGRNNDISKQEDEDVKKPLRPHKHPKKTTDSGIPIPDRTTTKRRESRDYYFTSARSLAGSATPPILWQVRSGPSAIGVDDGSSSEDEAFENPSSPTTATSVTQPKPIPRSSVGYHALVAASMSLPQQAKAAMQAHMGLSGRRLLQPQEHGMQNNVYGQWLGWMMAAIYMGGRIPQIWLNIKRGSVEGLNPLMFIFAVTANITYVGSILVRNTEWDKVKANLPWLLDAVACVLLDLFIILQFVYYKYFRNGGARGHEECGDSFEASKG